MYVRTQINKHTHTHTHTRAHAHARTHARTHKRTPAHKRTRTHTHAHTQQQQQQQQQQQTMAMSNRVSYSFGPHDSMQFITLFHVLYVISTQGFSCLGVLLDRVWQCCTELVHALFFDYFRGSVTWKTRPCHCPRQLFTRCQENCE